MYEVEVKVRADHATVRERLAELGAESVGEVAQADTYYDAPHREFAETDEALRVRRETRDRDEGTDGETTAELTYKGPLVEADSKTRREVETGVADAEAADDVLDALGFDPAATVRKDRERFALGDYTVTLDAVEGLGEFVEVETEVEASGERSEAGGEETDEAAIESARERAFEILRDLGLDPDDQIRTSYLGLLLAEDEADADEAEGNGK